MGLGKQLKTLSKGQGDAVLIYLGEHHAAGRNWLILLLGQSQPPAKDIARLMMTNDARNRVAREPKFQSCGNQSLSRSSAISGITRRKY